MHTANKEESELEDRFIALLREEYKGKTFSDFEEVTENGYRKYLLTIREEINAITYEIWPQNLGYSLAEIRYTTRPDFVFKCVSWRVDGQYRSFEEVQQVKDIIVYLDGYQFHASGSNLRVERDLKIRDAIGKPGRYCLWVFTWEDITNKSADAFYKKLNFDELNKISSRHPLLKGFDIASIKKVNSFMRFDYMLRAPLGRNELKLWSAVQLFSCQTKLLSKCISDDQLMTLLASGDETKVTFEQMKPQQFAVCDTLQFENELKAVCLAHPTTLEIKAAIFNTTPAGDYQKENWVLFWQVYNLLQFHNYSGVEKELESESRISDELNLVQENFRPELHDIVRSLLAQHININREYDFDLIEGGVIVAQAELGSDTKKFFMYPFDGESRSRFLAAGYREYTLETFDILNLQL
jgi:DEAD/DEAH box helicase domain-containing protein